MPPSRPLGSLNMLSSSCCGGGKTGYGVASFGLQRLTKEGVRCGKNKQKQSSPHTQPFNLF